MTTKNWIYAAIVVGLYLYFEKQRRDRAAVTYKAPPGYQNLYL